MTVRDSIDRAREEARLARLPAANAYAAVFRRDPKNGNDPVDVVLRDLRAFTCADMQCFVAGQPEQTAFNEGRRRVWLRIADMLRTAAGDKGRTNDDVD